MSMHSPGAALQWARARLRVVDNAPEEPPKSRARA
jgi:hypothetical protein